MPLDRHHTEFRVWAPSSQCVEVCINDERTLLASPGRGIFEGLAQAPDGTDYYYLLDGTQRLPDPCSRAQPYGTEGPSRVVDPQLFAWTDHDWKGINTSDLAIYELHVGTFTPEGTFEAVIPHLEYLRDLGVTAIELMPIGTFPGTRNWGYDVLYTYAPHYVYGGPNGLVSLIDAAHRTGLAVILDVIYNHLGPGREKLERFGPYFSDVYMTSWGPALNYDGPGSDAVREWAIQNACQWSADYHIDGLRIDAAHAIIDISPKHLVTELAERTRATTARGIVITAEHNRNDPRVLTDADSCGWGLDAQWANDFHCALHAALTNERHGGYADFGRVEDLASAFLTPFVLRGRYSHYRRRRQGTAPPLVSSDRFIVFSQNHDQVGNRRLGDRLPDYARELAALCLFFSPYTPLLFMGEEYGEARPFLFFTDHQDPQVAEMTRQGRAKQLAKSPGSPEELSDPQSHDTFTRSILGNNRPRTSLWNLHRDLLELRKTLPCVTKVQFDEGRRWLKVGRGDVILCCNLTPIEQGVPGVFAKIMTSHLAFITDEGVQLGPWGGAVLKER